LFANTYTLHSVLQNTFSFNNESEYHPWHIHGVSLWVVGQGEGNWEESDIKGYNLVNPVLRDTVNQWPESWTAVRVIFDNPGVWFFHCHIAAHLEMGMALTFVVDPSDMEDFPNLSDSTKYCEASNSLGIALSDKDGLGNNITVDKDVGEDRQSEDVAEDDLMDLPVDITDDTEDLSVDVTEDDKEINEINASPIIGLRDVMKWGVTTVALLWLM